jgi:hypothetical protein
VLIVVPWSGFWERNVLTSILPASRAWLESPFLRGGVTGVGVITAGAGLLELLTAFGLRRRREDAPRPTPPA